MIVRETIVHGLGPDRFSSVREVEFGFNDAAQALTEMGKSSPYPFEFDHGNRWDLAAALELEDTGEATIGWARFEVVDYCPECQRQITRRSCNCEEASCL
jgi:hypothetical protein